VTTEHDDGSRESAAGNRDGTESEPGLASTVNDQEVV